jgi:hypothetical protein|nr:MAG TPA: hypothetical protein [Caudoviricetes sp.]
MITRTEEEIQAVIAAIGQRIQEPQINQRRNAAVKEGYKEAIHILCNKIESYNDIPTRCHSVQSRAIAVLAVDFLHGECEHRILCGVPIKKL